MNKIFHGLLVVCLIVAVQIPSAALAGDVPEDVLRAAQEGIKSFVKDLPKDKAPLFGFLTQQDVDEATIGMGFQIFSVDPVRLSNATDTTANLSSLSNPIKMWEFLIMTRGKAAAILTVAFMKDHWMPVSIGAIELANQLDRLVTTWPAASGYCYRFIRVYQATSEFVELSNSHGIIGIISLGSARSVMGENGKDFDPENIHTPADVVKKIKIPVRENIEKYEFKKTN